MRFSIRCLLPILLLVLMLTQASGRSLRGVPTEPRLRGAMVTTFATVADLRDLAALGANCVRWQLMWEGFPSARANTEPLSSYLAWMETALQHVDTMLPHCRRLGLRVVLDVHTPPGGQTPQDHWRLFQQRELQRGLASLWRNIAIRYRGDTTIWAFDLMNEPNEAGSIPDSALSWQGLALELAQAVRAEDSTRRLVVEPAPWGSSRSLVKLIPLPLSNVVYSFHMYDHAAFTHQGLFGDTTRFSYPGKVWGETWNRKRLRRWLRPVREWQKQYRVPMYVGEFSAVRWAPDESAYNYIRDCIRTFERWDWHWTYHAWRESHVWSVEHGPDRANEAPVPGGTKRLELLRKAFGKNKNFR